MGLTPQRVAKGSKGRLGVQPLGVVPHGDQQGDGAVRADAHRYEQLWGVTFNEPGQALVQLVDLPGELFDTLREPLRSPHRTLCAHNRSSGALRDRFNRGTPAWRVIGKMSA